VNVNITRIKAVNQVLKELPQEFVFVGGATVELYVSKPEVAPEVRPTDDVDVVVELASYSGYSELDEKLRKIGFVNDIASGVMCRYKFQGLIVDVMPTHPEAVGFSNKWYPEGFKTAQEIVLDDQSSIKIFNLPYFIASKWEAFKGRGNNDYRTSKDFEDLVYIFENVDDFKEQITVAPEHLLKYFKEEFKPLIEDPDFEEGLFCHLTGGYGGVDANYIFEKLKDAFEIR